jgi:acetyl-CoA carboxylase biotin carboxyl carrier protein
MALNIEVIKDLVNIISASDITEFSIDCDEVSIKIKRGGTGAQPLREAPMKESLHQVAPEPSGEMAEEDEDKLVVLHSPMVGTFYQAPSPDAEPYVNVGDYVRRGDIVCIIEAMKLMNEIEAETEGQIVKILVDNADPVEYGQPLLLLRKI